MPLPLGLPPPTPRFELFVASHGMSEGLSQTSGGQIIPRLSLVAGPIQLGGQWRNISSPIASGIAAFFLKWGHHGRRTQIETAVLYRIRTKLAAGADGDAWEFDGSIRHSFGKLGVRATAECSPKEFEAGQSLYVEAGPTVQIGKAIALYASVGRRERQGASNYSTFNTGATYALGHKLSLDARLYATDNPQRGSRYRTRLVVSARLTL